MTKKEIYDYLQTLFCTTSDAEIARKLGVEDRQKIKQWADGVRQNDITTAIMTLLIDKLEKAECSKQSY